MRKSFMLASLLISSVAVADDASVTATSTKTIGIDGGIALPTGDWGDAVGFGVGALARFEMPINAKMVFTARAGYIQHMEKEGGGGDSTTAEIPLFGGIRYAFSQSGATAIYGAAELGLVNYRVSIDVDGDSMSNSDTNLGMTLGGGYRAGKLDVRGGLYFPDVDHADDAMGVIATVGYDISAL